MFGDSGGCSLDVCEVYRRYQSAGKIDCRNVNERRYGFALESVSDRSHSGHCVASMRSEQRAW